MSEERELIDLARLIDVLTVYGADKAAEDSPARKALDQLKRGCVFRLNDKVLIRNGDETTTEWSKGVIVCYMLHEACFVVGPGNNRDKLPKHAQLAGVGARYLVPRDALPEGGKIVPWKVTEKKPKEKAK